MTTRVPLPLQSRLKLAIELFVLFCIGPFLIGLGITGRSPIPVLILGSMAVFYILNRAEKFDNRSLYTLGKNRVYLSKVVIPRFILSLLVVGGCVLYFTPEKFLMLPQKNIRLWLAICIFYPILSVYPQEILYRAFFFFRYKRLFEDNELMVMVSSICFGLAHLIYGNWVSVVLSWIGGLFFSSTYLKTRSTLVASLEHSIYGIMIFTIGLGEYFYKHV